MPSMPRVTMKAGTKARVMMRPLTKPASAPAPMVAMTAMGGRQSRLDRDPGADDAGKAHHRAQREVEPARAQHVGRGDGEHADGGGRQEDVHEVADRQEVGLSTDIARRAPEARSGFRGGCGTVRWRRPGSGPRGSGRFLRSGIGRGHGGRLRCRGHAPARRGSWSQGRQGPKAPPGRIIYLTNSSSGSVPGVHHLLGEHEGRHDDLLRPRRLRPRPSRSRPPACRRDRAAARPRP
jgi:hypothetical protein